MFRTTDSVSLAEFVWLYITEKIQTKQWVIVNYNFKITAAAIWQGASKKLC